LVDLLLLSTTCSDGEGATIPYHDSTFPHHDSTFPYHASTIPYNDSTIPYAGSDPEARLVFHVSEYNVGQRVEIQVSAYVILPLRHSTKKTPITILPHSNMILLPLIIILLPRIMILPLFVMILPCIVSMIPM